MIFRVSQKLTAKIETGALSALPLHQNRLADWSATLFVSSRTQYILVTNTQSLYSTVMFGQGITDDHQFIQCALSNIRESMKEDGLEFVYLRSIVPETGTVRFAKVLDRSVTGSMNDMVKHATFWLAEGDMAPFEAGFKLNEIPMSALGSNGAAYGIPRDVFKEMIASVEE